MSCVFIYSALLILRATYRGISDYILHIKGYTSLTADTAARLEPRLEFDLHVFEDWVGHLCQEDCRRDQVSSSAAQLNMSLSEDAKLHSVY